MAACFLFGSTTRGPGRKWKRAPLHPHPLHPPPPLMSRDTGEDWGTIISPLKRQWVAIRQIGEKVSDFSKPSERCDFLDTCTSSCLVLLLFFSLVCCAVNAKIAPNCVTFKYTNIVVIFDLKAQCGIIH